MRSITLPEPPASPSGRVARVRQQSRRRLELSIVVAAGAVAMVAVARYRAEPSLPQPLTTYYFPALLRTDATIASAEVLSVPWLYSDRERRPSRRARAVRIGALLADVELAAVARNQAAPAAYYLRDPVALGVVSVNSAIVSTQSRLLAREVRALDHNARALPSIQALVASGDRRATIGAELMATRAEVLSLPHAQLVALGNWMQTARVAALVADSGFFRNHQSLEMIEWAASLRPMDPTTRSAVARVRELVSASKLDLDGIGLALTNALQLMAG